MGDWRDAGTECPISPEPVSLRMCGDCPYFRGGSGMFGRAPRILCNWPRNGSHIAVQGSLDDLAAADIERMVRRV